jgi:hypothetical protein
MKEAMFLIFLLFSKHFFIDHPFQTDYQRNHKHIYAHWGGILHSLLHGLVTGIILMFFISNPWVIVGLAMFDIVAHYHIDWIFSNFMERTGWSPQCDKEYWWFKGLSQYLHAVTYILIVLFALSL